MFEMDSQASEVALMAKGKQPYMGKTWDRNKTGKFQPRNRGMTDSKYDSHDKKNDGCFYCGNLVIMLKTVIKGKLMNPNKSLENIMEVM